MLKVIIWAVLLYLVLRSGRNLVRAMVEDVRPPVLPPEQLRRRRPWEEIEDARWVDLD
jgi:hypothetical protein